MKPKKAYKFINVQWIDAQSDCEWCSPDKIEKWANEDCVILEQGWLVYENKKYIVITNQIGQEDGEFGNRTKIPKGWIIKRSDK